MQATLIGFAIALVLGLIFALIRQSNNRIVNNAMAETVEFIRSTVGDSQASPAELEAEFFAKMRPLSLIRRLIEADEIAATVAFLASPLAAATNGAAIRAEGGIVPTIA